jgi:hypothetical protein
MQAALMFVVLVLAVAYAFSAVAPATAQAALPVIYIQQDGTVNPTTAPIHQSGNTYTFTGDLYGAVKILKSNIVLDGAGHTLSGSFAGNSSNIWVVGSGPPSDTVDYTIGVDLIGGDVNGVTVANLNVKNFSIGMYIWTQNNTVVGNTLSDCIVGLLISGKNDSITGNTVAGNMEGLFFGPSADSGDQLPTDVVVYQNAFLHNNMQISGCLCKSYNLSETPHYWDNGKVGNYWSDYNGTDGNKDGVGDNAYVIDPLNQDRYPLMSSVQMPENSFPFVTVVVGVCVVVVVVVAAVLALNRKRRKT